jgi:hypothetical protein
MFFAVPNVSILITQTMNPSVVHIVIPINYQTTWSQPITPIILGKTSMLPISTYPMWYNVIPPFVLLDSNLYPTYQIRAKGLDFSIFKNYIGYVLKKVYPILEQHVIPPKYIPYFVGNQFPIMVQLMTSKDKRPVQQPITILVPITVQITTSLLIHIPRGSNHQPPDGRQP